MKSMMIALLCLAILPASGRGQDSGPGPVGPATSNVYAVTLLKRMVATDATFSFSADPSDGQSTTTSTNGTFLAMLEQGNVEGTWNAVDVGGYSIWVAHAQGDAQTFSAVGLSTPDVVIGRATISSNTSSRFGAFFRLLGIGGHSSMFFGEAVVEETPEDPEAPETPTDMAA